MLIPVLLFIVGLLCLIKGGDWFVDGATGIARRFHVPELLIGATVVSIDAGLAAGIFHQKLLGIRELKEYLNANGVEMRL